MPHPIHGLSVADAKVIKKRKGFKVGIIDKDSQTGDFIRAVSHTDGSRVVYLDGDEGEYVRVLDVQQMTDGKFGELMEFVVDDMESRMIKFFNVVNTSLIEALDNLDVEKETLDDETVVVAKCYWEETDQYDFTSEV
jgi:hypothetical protein